MRDRELGAVIEWLQAADVPATVLRRARLLLLDTVGCAIAGAAEPEVRNLAAALPTGSIRMPGMPHALAPEAFATVFAAGACWHEACEGLAVAHGRPGLHAIPAVLALALGHGATIGAVLDAMIAGYEVGGRLGAAWRIRPGMHVDGGWGALAAAASAATLLRADVLAAVRHAACHMPVGLYWPIVHGSPARNLYAGHGAVHGMGAAAAAKAGLGGPPGSLDEAARVVLGYGLPPLIPPGVWLLPDGYLKAFAAVKHVHYGAHAAAAWHALGQDPDRIEAVTLRIYEEALTYCSNRAPVQPIQAQFSLTYGLVHALRHGDLTPAAYTGAAFADHGTRRLEALVRIEPLPGPTRRCELVVDGWSMQVARVPGDADWPLDEAAVAAKVRTYAGPVLGDGPVEALIEHLLRDPPDARLTLA